MIHLILNGPHAGEQIDLPRDPPDYRSFVRMYRTTEEPLRLPGKGLAHSGAFDIESYAFDHVNAGGIPCYKWVAI